MVHYDDAFITWARRESKRVREKEKKNLQTICAFSSKTKALTQRVSISIEFSSSELREGMKKNGRGGKYIQVKATQS